MYSDPTQYTMHIYEDRQLYPHLTDIDFSSPDSDAHDAPEALYPWNRFTFLKIQVGHQDCCRIVILQ